MTWETGIRRLKLALPEGYGEGGEKSRMGLQGHPPLREGQGTEEGGRPGSEGCGCFGK